ncbi:hypothetical protein ACX8XP_13000 [Calditrichota bacterium LG25]
MSQFFKPGELVPKTGIYLSEFYEINSYFSAFISNDYNSMLLIAIIETMIELGANQFPTRKKRRFLIAGSHFPGIPGISPGWKLSKWWKF